MFAHPDARVARSVRDAMATALGLRLEVSGTGLRPARPTARVRAVAAVGAVWAVTAQAVAQLPCPRERVVSDAWSVAKEILAPVPHDYARARRSW
ncbi:hypothetical protein [Streptomyces mexicanus]|uniref:hypothetical protein n=1 Tax=Streptomyces mexicanus TaxID=178566 RepID=UPI001356FD98|nr:hypothetical protein [Streptomyces mexicanus]